MARSQWVLDNGESCKAANRRTDTALVGGSRLRRDHNCIYMIMKSGKTPFLRGAGDGWSAFTLTSVAAAVLDMSCHHTILSVSLFKPPSWWCRCEQLASCIILQQPLSQHRCWHFPDILVTSMIHRPVSSHLFCACTHKEAELNWASLVTYWHIPE